MSVRPFFMQNLMYGDIPGYTYTIGYLYNWYAINDARGLAPTGWHMATKDEMDELIAFCGGSTVAGGVLKETGTTHWSTPNTGAVDSYKFRLIGSGHRSSQLSNFSDILTNGFMFSSAYNTTQAYRAIAYNTDATMAVSIGYKADGYPVRCIKDDSNNSGPVTDYDGNTYPTIKVGNQVWMAQNLKVTRYNNGDTVPVVTNQATWNRLTTGAKCAYNNDNGNI